MYTNLIVESHTETEIEDFSHDVSISIERARYIEAMRQRFLADEHNYSKPTNSVYKETAQRK